MITLISIIIILASILLVAVVFVQNPKGGGLSSDFGAAQQLGGVQRTTDFIEKSTWTLAVVIMAGSIGLSAMMKKPKPVAVDPASTQQQGPAGQKPAPGNSGRTAPAPATPGQQTR